MITFFLLNKFESNQILIKFLVCNKKKSVIAIIEKFENEWNSENFEINEICKKNLVFYKRIQSNQFGSIQILIKSLVCSDKKSEICNLLKILVYIENFQKFVKGVWILKNIEISKN